MHFSSEKNNCEHQVKDGNGKYKPVINNKSKYAYIYVVKEPILLRYYYIDAFFKFNVKFNVKFSIKFGIYKRRSL